MFPLGGALTWSEVGPRPVISHPIKRCDWLKPCVTAPGRTRTTSAIESGTGSVDRESGSVGRAGRCAGDDGPGAKVVPGEVAFVRCSLARLPSAGNVLIAAHEDAAIGEQDRRGMVAARVFHDRARYPARRQVLGVQDFCRAASIGNTAGEKHTRVRHQDRVHLVGARLVQVGQRLPGGHGVREIDNF